MRNDSLITSANKNGSGRSALSSCEMGRFIHVSYYYRYYYKSLSVPHGCFLKGVVT